MVNYQYNDWRSKTWRNIKADIFLEINKALATQIKTLPKEIRGFGRGYNVIVDKVKNMGTVLPLISALHSEFMEERHWDQVKALTKQSFDQASTGFTFESVIKLELYKYEAQINEIVDIAQKENKIEKKLKTIEQNWNKQSFEFDEYRETKLFKGVEIMMELLEQNTMDLMGMRAQGKYVEFFLKTVDDWKDKLSRVDSVVNEWL
jgi:dynein heavy chain, axonemal